jgi:hypothetical protein
MKTVAAPVISAKVVQVDAANDLALLKADPALFSNQRGLCRRPPCSRARLEFKL